MSDERETLSERVMLRLSPSEVRKLDARAKSEQRSRSAMARILLLDGLREGRKTIEQ